ncbi:MAG: PAS domain S-box protein [Myxococcota bacterium]
MASGETKDRRGETGGLLVEAEELVGVAAWAWDVVRDQVTYSDGLCRLLGRSHAELGHTFLNAMVLVDEATRERCASTIRQTIETGCESYTVELPVEHPTRGQISVQVCCQVVRDCRGRATRFVGTLLDVSERQGAERRLAQQQQFLDAIIENIPDMIFIKDAVTLRFERFNRAGEQLLGYERSELLGKSDFDFFPRDQAESFTARDREVLAGRSVIDVPEERVLTRHNGIRILHTKKVPLFDEDGRPSHLLGISEDITDKKRAEEFRLSDLLVRSLDEYAVFLLDVEGRVRTWNLGAERVTGYTDSEVIGTPLAHLWDEAGLGSALERAASEGCVTLEVTWRLKDERVIWTVVTLSAVYGDGDSPVLFGVVAKDVTSRRRSEGEREALLTRLQEALRLRDEFLSVASHELRTPVATLKLQAGLFSQLLKRSPDELVAQLPKLVTRLSHQCDRLERMVDALLDVSRLTAGRMELHRELVDLCAIASQVIGRAREDTRGSQEIALVCPGNEVRGFWDPLRIDQILTNLVSIAMKYGNALPVEVCIEAQPDTALVRVSDHGIGIAKQDCERIFGQFERAVSGRHFGGFGMGLFITERLVTAHGGKISVESVPGEGATFSVELPYGSRDSGRR